MDKHKEELVSYLNCLNSPFNVILLTECGKAIQASIEETFSNYDFYLKPPSTSKGGAGILIRKNIFKNVELIDKDKHFSYNDCSHCLTESLWIKMNTNANENNSLVIGCIYKHPCKNLSHLAQFNSKYNEVIKSINKTATCIIGGDYNIDLLEYDDKKQIGENLDMNLENNYTPCITLPTRITHHSATLIDQIYLRLPKPKLQAKVRSGNLFCSITDHLMSFVLVEMEIDNSKERPYVRLFTKNHINYFLQNAPNDPPLLPTTPDGSEPFNSVHAAYLEFLRNSKNMLDKYFPLVRLSRKKFKNKPWITSGIRVSIRHRNHLYKKYVQNRTLAREQAWKTFRNKVTDCIRASETLYYQKILTKQNNNCKNLWKIFGKMLKKDKNKVNICKIKVNDTNITNSSQITNAFNDFFTNIGSNLANSFQNTDKKNYREYLGNPIEQSINLRATNPFEIKTMLEHIDPKKSTGSDDMPAKFLTISASVIAEPSSRLFNLSITSGQYPDSLKIAKVLPIFKKGEHTDMNNYRPISILTHINKIFEQLICKQMKSFLTKHNVYYDYQYGFREKHSTEHALIEITDSIKCALDSKQLVCGIFVDLKKAFDTVNHKILLEKLNKVGIRGTDNNLISNYLTNRYQYVQIDNTRSRLLPINYGVPQGSVLGPLLFTLYINDLANCTTKGKIRIFADDTAVYFECKNIKEMMHTSTEIMKRLDDWFAANLLTLNTDKSYFCIFRTTNNHMLDTQRKLNSVGNL